MDSNIKKYAWLLNVFVVILVSFLLSRIATLFLAGWFFPDVVVSPKLEKRSVAGLSAKQNEAFDLDVILKRNFFDANETPIDIPACPNPPCEQPPIKEQTIIKDDRPITNSVAVKTSLNITLRGTITVADGRDPRSTAVIEANRGAAASFKVGETFMPNVEITRILHKRIEFLNKDVLEYAEVIEFVKPEGGARVASLTDQPNRVTRSDAPADTSGEIKQDGNNFTIPKSVFDNAISPENLPVLLTQARVVPFWRDGKAEGFKFINIKSGSIFEKLGLRRGDVLKSINGQVPEMQKGFQMLSDLKDESNFTLELERRGVPQTFSYQKT